MAFVELANYCNHNHPYDGTRGEVRVLPIGGSANVHVCRQHFDIEMAFRRERIAAGAPFDLPTWESLALLKDA